MPAEPARIPNRFSRPAEAPWSGSTTTPAFSSWSSGETGGTSGNDRKSIANASTSSSTTFRVIQPGDTSKTDPFTILFVSNPAIESPWKSGVFQYDPIRTDQNAFDNCVDYSVACVMGMLPGQAEMLLSDPAIGPKIRIVSSFISDRPAQDANALVAEDSVSDLLIARREVYNAFLATMGIAADIVFAVSKSATHSRASSWYTSDNNAGPGYDFFVDGVTLSHRFYNLVPGTVALPAAAREITALHEFGHALSSYENGMVVDLYIDNDPALNNKRARPIPSLFASYESSSLGSDSSRGGIGYPDSWQSFHCERIAVAAPSVMDNYYLASGGPVTCSHDRITRAFLYDRMTAKLSR